MYLKAIFHTYVLLLPNAKQTIDKQCGKFTKVVNASFAHCIDYYFSCE